jgi:putative ABC transport system permease protein
VRGGELRSVIFGEAGVWLALALAAVGALTSFICAAGPREQTANQNGAIRTAVGQIAPGDRTILASADWYPEAGVPSSFLTPALQQKFGRAFALHFGSLISAPAGSGRAFVTGPLVQPLPPAGPATAHQPKYFQLSADSGLAADARLMAGTWPAGPSRLPGTSAAARAMLVLQVVLPNAVATRYHLGVGVVLPLGIIGGRPVALRVTGIIQPKPGAFFWATPDVQAVPALLIPAKVTPTAKSGYIGGAIVAASELQALQSVWPDQLALGDWYFPVSLSHLTRAGLARLAAAITALTASTDAATGGRASGFNFAPTPSASSLLPAALTTIRQQVNAASGIDDLVIGGLFAACLLLMLLCAGLAADRYRPELALIRTRGGSTGQVATRTLARSLSVSVPGIAAGLAVASRLGAPAASQWALPAINGAFAIAAVPARCTWRTRENRSWQAAERTDSAAPRRAPRRIIAEIAVLTIAAGAVVALRLRGVAGGSDQLGIAAPVLVATVASIVIGRLYPIPVRALLPLAMRRRGPVSFLGLSQARRAGLASIVPALALVLTLTLAAFGVMLTQSVAAGQIASTWAKTGADAIFTAPGNNVITPVAQHAVAAVPGVLHTALVFTAAYNGQFPNSLITTAGQAENISIAVVSPAEYGALSNDTPWPGFPVPALARRPGPVPILISAVAVADQPGAVTGTRLTLNAYGIKVGVRVAGTIGTTPAFPAGGAFVVFPQWAIAQLPSIPGPDELLATGPHVSVSRLDATAALHLHGDTLQLRSALLGAQLGSAAEYAVRLFDLASVAAAALSAVALCFGLAATGKNRRILRTQMSAMGMSAGQARALALYDPLALLATAIAGMILAVGLLSLIARQIIPLQSLTSSTTGVALSLSLLALAIPAAGAIALALVVIATEHVLTTRSESGTALRYEEAG